MLGAGIAYGQGNRLVATGDYAYWINMSDGTVDRQFPQVGVTRVSRALPNPHGWGRGVLFDGQLVWPTKRQIYLLAPEARPGEVKVMRQIPLGPRTVKGGDLRISSKGIAITSGDRLTMFHVQESNQADER